LVDVLAAYASVLEAQGDVKEARKQLDDVIAIDLKIRGEHHLYVGNDYVRRGHADYKLGHLDAARDDFERGLAIYLKNVNERISPDHVFIAEAKAWIARIRLEQVGPENRERVGKESEPHAEQAYDIFRAALRDNSVEVAISGAIYGRALALQRKELPHARALLAAALPIVIKARGPGEKITQLIREWLEEVACS
jgi:tetratricopeptide (TPR) repeat protein